MVSEWVINQLIIVFISYYNVLPTCSLNTSLVVLHVIYNKSNLKNTNTTEALCFKTFIKYTHTHLIIKLIYWQEYYEFLLSIGKSTFMHFYM